MKKIINLLDYMLLFLLIMEANTIHVSLIGSFKVKFLIVVVMGALIVLNSIGLLVTEELIKRIILFFVFYFSFLMALILVHGDLRNDFILLYFFAVPFGILLVTEYLTKSKFLELLEKFNKIVFALAVISLFFSFFGSILNYFVPTNYIWSNWTENRIDASYYGVYYETQRIWFFDNLLIRNTGMFTEAPMWNFPLCLALINEYYLIKKSSNIRKIIFSLTILTTLSTTGIFIVGLIYIYMLVYRYKGKYKIFLISILMGIICLLYSVLKEKSTTGSASLRYDDFMIGMSIWIENSIFGVGENFSKELISRMETSSRGIGYSNGLLVLLGTGGIILFLMLFSWLLYFMICRIKLDYKFIGILVLFLIFNTIVNEKILFLMLCSIGYGVILNKKVREGSDSVRESEMKKSV